MRLVRNIALFIVALYIGITLFMPKSQLYYYGEQQLKNKGITIGNEKLVDTIGSLKVLHAVAYYQGVDIARATKVKFTPLLLVNIIKAEDIELLNIAKQFLNIHIDSINAKQTIFNPNRVNIDATGSFGTAHGYVNLKNRFIHLDITKATNISNIRQYLKKSEKGWYYESKF